MLKQLLFRMEDISWSIRCSYNFWLHGPYGLTRTIEKIPFKFLIKYMRKYGAKIGAGVIIDSGFKLHRPDGQLPLKNLVIGNDVYIGHRILIDLSAKVIFENDSAMGGDCQIWTHVGDYNEKLRDKSDYREKIAHVIIHEGVICYSKVILNPGVEVGKKARVLALSMVSNKIPDSQIWGGVPAEFIKNREL